jgi:activator of 2-hydroxyglutaryl-CoA dehydratase
MINSDDNYTAYELIPIPEGIRIPTVDVFKDTYKRRNERRQVLTVFRTGYGKSFLKALQPFIGTSVGSPFVETC